MSREQVVSVCRYVQEFNVKFISSKASVEASPRPRCVAWLDKQRRKQSCCTLIRGEAPISWPPSTHVCLFQEEQKEVGGVNKRERSRWAVNGFHGEHEHAPLVLQKLKKNLTFLPFEVTVLFYMHFEARQTSSFCVRNQLIISLWGFQGGHVHKNVGYFKRKSDFRSE